MKEKKKNVKSNKLCIRIFGRKLRDARFSLFIIIIYVFHYIFARGEILSIKLIFVTSNHVRSIDHIGTLLSSSDTFVFPFPCIRYILCIHTCIHTYVHFVRYILYVVYICEHESWVSMLFYKNTSHCSRKNFIGYYFIFVLP